VSAQLGEEAATDGLDVLRLGLVAAPGLPAELAEELAAELPALLADRVSDRVRWEVETAVDPRAADPARGGVEAIETCRERLVEEGWSLAVCLTDLPLRIGRRPVVADASATHGVALVSLPALGALHLRRRAGEAIAELLGGLVGVRMGGAPDAEEQRARRRHAGRRLTELAAPVRRVVPEDDDVDLRYVAAVVRGNLRLLSGMVRANQPWRLIVGLSRALAAAVGAVAFAVVTSDIWRLADALGWARLAVLTVVSIAVTVVSLIVAHDLWERPGDPAARERAVLFNVATAATVTLGIVSLYAGLFALTLAAAGLVLTSGVLSDALGHHAGLGDYVELAWMVSSLATVGGALGAGLESDAAVRQAAYGYRPSDASDPDASSHSRIEV
jgi:hypothetical protein